jgi:hypothetical protein
MTTERQEALKKFEPALKQLGDAQTEIEYIAAIEGVKNEIQKWQHPIGREIEIAESYKELINQLTDYSHRRLKGETKEQLTNEILTISFLINGLYGLYHP